ncbi:phosphotransferase enzyme family protein [Saccharibacillus sp. JS10]|uniref:phosphotransferase enzyme family protein n=1 Tax=Saccharibacillus sp. JS10 TaxID=2950552 RepID=UPI00210A33FB|nr:phosphotransferase [Saccharibacillus sp. JS10]MCQ4088501.1 phosphotransferase [Saccharibacillus sp. JS10]
MNDSHPDLKNIPDSGEPIAARSVLRPSYVKRRLSGLYEAGDWTECRYWLRGLNDTYRVRTEDGGRYMLRVYRADVRESDVVFELELLERLQGKLTDASSAAVSPAVRLADGSLYTALQAPEGVRFAALFREAEGAEDLMQDEESCIAFGRSAAELHAAMDEIAPELAAGDFAASSGSVREYALADGSYARRAAADAETLLRAPLRMILAYIGEDHSEANFLRSYAQELEKAAAEAAAGGLDFGICHGDMHGNNNALRQGDRFAHFDFEFAAPGWRAWDVAQFKNRKRQSSEQIEPLWQAFLQGYRYVRPFSAADEAAVSIFTVIRRFWTMGLDAEISPVLDGELDYGEDWLHDFIQEFRENSFGKAVMDLKTS